MKFIGIDLAKGKDYSVYRDKDGNLRKIPRKDKEEQIFVCNNCGQEGDLVVITNHLISCHEES